MFISLEATPDLAHALPLLASEMERGRRYRRPLSIVVVRDGDAGVPAVRASDRVVRVDTGRTMFIAPETDRREAEAFAGRLRAASGAEVEGVASFPDDGPSPEALLIAAGLVEPDAGAAEATG